MSNTKMMDAIDSAYALLADSVYTNDFEDILIQCGANDDDSDSELGYFAGMSNEQIEEAFNRTKELLKKAINAMSPVEVNQRFFGYASGGRELLDQFGLYIDDKGNAIEEALIKEEEFADNTEDFIINVKENSEDEDWDPVDAAATKEEAIDVAKMWLDSGYIAAEVVYMPEDDEDIAEVVWSSENKVDESLVMNEAEDTETLKVGDKISTWNDDKGVVINIEGERCEVEWEDGSTSWIDKKDALEPLTENNCIIEEAEEGEQPKTRKYVSEFSEEEINEFVSKIDWNALNEHVSQLIGIKVNMVPGELRKGQHISVEDTTNYADKCGIMSPVYEKVNVDCFNSSLAVDRNTGKLFYWCTPHFSYEYKTYGSNGTEICRASFLGSDEGWYFDDRAIGGKVQIK